MIYLSRQDLSADTVTHLANKQTLVDGNTTYEEKVKEAKRLWGGKEGSIEGQHAFTEIKAKLTDMCSGVEDCAYCQHNEKADIEHFYPKRLFPNYCFKWDNYLYICNKCNRDYKNDFFKIFVPFDGETHIDITPRRSVFIEPINDDAVLINPAKEDPMFYLELDLIAEQYIFVPKIGLSARDNERAEYTKELLGLNRRAHLINARKAAYRFYMDRLRECVKIREAISFDQLEDIIQEFVPGYGSLNRGIELEQQKNDFLAKIKDHVLSYPHSVVWKEIIRQRAHLPSDELLRRVPEVLYW